MKHLHSQQSGFTPTLTCKQVIKLVSAYGKSVVVFVAGEIKQKQTPGPQLARQCQGFSLVETFVAITILLIVIVGPMTISSAVSKSTSFSSEQVTAFLLAQEGAEIAQKARDDLQLESDVFGGSNSTSWGDFNDTSGVYAACFSAAGCGLELNTDAVGTVAVIDCAADDCRLRYNGDEGERAYYTYVLQDSTSASNELSPFTRVINFEVVNSDEVKVTSKVTWRSSSFRREQEVVVETFLLNVNGN